MEDEQDGGVDSFSPATEHGSRFTVSNARSPSSPPLCHNKVKWFPTHATINVNGTSYEWNSRNHRKLRYVLGPRHPEKWNHRIVFLGWEPYIVSWYIAWIGTIANTLWVVNGFYATWPGQAATGELAERVSYGTGIVGSFLFIVTGFLSYVESINHTYSAVIVASTPNHPGSKRQFLPPVYIYGTWPHHPLAQLEDHVKLPSLLEHGYPLVQDAESNRIVTAAFLDQAVRGCKLHIRMGERMLHVTVDEIVPFKHQDAVANADAKPQQGYRWWTWSPDLRHMGIAAATVFFASTILFFIPACAWLPMFNKDAPVGELVFWLQVTQVNTNKSVARAFFCNRLLYNNSRRCLCLSADYFLHWIHLLVTRLDGRSFRFVVATRCLQHWLVDFLVQCHWKLRVHDVCCPGDSRYCGIRLIWAVDEMGCRLWNLLGFVCLLGGRHTFMYRVWEPASDYASLMESSTEMRQPTSIHSS